MLSGEAKGTTMNLPSEPKRYKELPQFNGLPNFGALKKLLEHIEAIQTGVTRSLEHAFPIIPYAKRKGLNDIVALQNLRQTKDFESSAFDPSAFDEGTIQDLKFHEKAHEVFFLLKGSLKILWKKNMEATFKHELILTRKFPYAFIPSGHCLLVGSERVGAFLAIAWKTKKSTISNGGKVLGENCPNYESVQCDIRQSCERIRANRSRFYDAVKISRATAVTNVKTIAQDFAPIKDN